MRENINLKNDLFQDVEKGLSLKLGKTQKDREN